MRRAGRLTDPGGPSTARRHASGRRSPRGRSVGTPAPGWAIGPGAQPRSRVTPGANSVPVEGELGLEGGLDGRPPGGTRGTPRRKTTSRQSTPAPARRRRTLGLVGRDHGVVGPLQQEDLPGHPVGVVDGRPGPVGAAPPRAAARPDRRGTATRSRGCRRQGPRGRSRRTRPRRRRNSGPGPGRRGRSVRRHSSRGWPSGDRSTRPSAARRGRRRRSRRRRPPPTGRAGRPGRPVRTRCCRGSRRPPPRFPGW